MIGDPWIKPSVDPAKKTVTLQADYYNPSSSLLCRVEDYKKFLADFIKKNPSQASKLTPEIAGRTNVKLSCVAGVQVILEWRYVRH